MPIAHLLHISIVLLLLVTHSSAQAQGWTAIPFNAPCLPLAVRSPYLNAWLNQGPKSAQVNDLWPNLWTPKAPTIVGWSAAIQVDNTTYSVLGMSPVWPNSSKQISSEFTPTRTIFDLTAGPINLTASFLSPINPTDLMRQSLPFSYFYINVTSNDGNAHDVRLYSDISAEWVSGNLNSIVDWSVTNEDGVIMLQTQRQTIAGFSEINDHAEDSTAYYSMLEQSGVTFKIGQDSVSRGQFVSNGALDGGVDQSFRPLSQDFPVFAISMNLGSIKQTSSPVVWGLGLLRDPAIQYTTSAGEVQQRSSYFWSQYPTPPAAVEFSLKDFNNSLNNATALDSQILQDASRYSSQYADLLALTVRQAMGPMDITLARDSSGNWNTSDVKAFMKNLGSGNGGVNEVDVLYASFPAYLYLNPQLGKYLLAPLLEFQESSQYTNAYAAQNLGTNYPNATGNTAAHNLGIEESANMLIMVLAHAQATGDPSLIAEHYSILKKWADYLVENSLSPNSQITDDGFVGTNQTNLAVKGIIAIGAMAKISGFLNEESDGTMYQNISTSYIRQWETLSTSIDGDHLLADYGDQSSSGLIYNLYADKLLQLDLIPQSIYDGQSNFYANQFGQRSDQFGLPVDSSDSTITRTDWMMLTAGSVSDSSLQMQFVSGIYQYASVNRNNTPLSLSYDTTNGAVRANIASPAQGSLFSLLALNQTVHKVTVPANSTVPVGNTATNSSSATDSLHRTEVGAIVGGVIGGIAGAAIVILALVFVLRRRRRQKLGGHFDTIEPNPMLQYRGDGPELLSNMTPEHFVSPVLAVNSTQSTNNASSAGPAGPSSSTFIIHSSPPIPSERTSRTTNNHQSSSMQGTHGHSNSTSTIDPSMSASQREGSSSVTASSASQTSSERARQRALMERQALMNEELRSEMDNLRRDLERIREDRILDEAPPSYVPSLDSRA